MSFPCRVCMCSEFDNGTLVFDCIETTIIAEQIMSICNVLMSRDDGLPQQICPVCLQELRNAIEFKLKCENTDTILKAMNIATQPGLEIKFEQDMDIKTEIKDEYISYNEFPEVEIDHSDSNDDCSTQDEKIFKCNECGKGFKSKIKMAIHLKKHSFVCYACKRQFVKQSSLDKHLEGNYRDCRDISEDNSIFVQGIGKERIFCCTKCDYKTVRMIHMRSHLVTHTGLKPFVCDMCPKAYTQMGPLQYHKQQMHATKDMSVTCEICGKKVHTKKQLWNHLKTHSGKKYSCNVCNAELKSKVTLAQHMTRHMGVKNYSCELCAAAFYTLSELCNHKKIHLEKVRSFPCPRCEYRASRKSMLKSHLEKHSDDKPFSCNTCGRMFETSNHLKMHAKKHVAEKRYKCPLCPTLFSHIKSMRRHLMRNHDFKGLKGADVALHIMSYKTELSAEDGSPILHA